METVTLVAAIIAAVAAVAAAGIAARATRKQVEAAEREGALTRENAERLARRAERQDDITRLTDWAINGTDKQALYAMDQLEAMLDDTDLDERQLNAVYGALLVAHEGRFEALDTTDPPLLRAETPVLDAPGDTGREEAGR